MPRQAASSDPAQPAEPQEDGQADGPEDDTGHEDEVGDDAFPPGDRVGRGRVALRLGSDERRHPGRIAPGYDGFPPLFAGGPRGVRPPTSRRRTPRRSRSAAARAAAADARSPCRLPPPVAVSVACSHGDLAEQVDELLGPADEVPGLHARHRAAPAPGVGPSPSGSAAQAKPRSGSRGLSTRCSFSTPRGRAQMRTISASASRPRPPGSRGVAASSGWRDSKTSADTHGGQLGGAQAVPAPARRHSAASRSSSV